MSPTEHIEWLSTAEAARRLGVTVRDVYALVDQGQLTGDRFGRVIRLRADERRPLPRGRLTAAGGPV